MLILLASCTGKTNTAVVPAIQFAAPGAEEIQPPEMASSIKLDSTTMQVYYIDIPDGEIIVSAGESAVGYRRAGNSDDRNKKQRT